MGTRQVLKILITGSTGIAGATAALARECGHSVVTIGLDESADIQADLRDGVAVAASFTRVVERLEGLDSLFNAAGISGRKLGDGAWHECTRAGFDATIESNAVTMFQLTAEALRYWLDLDQTGCVLNMGSVLASRPEPERFASLAYAASKGAIEAMTISGAACYASRRIRMNVIAPGLVRTPMSLRAQADPAILRYISGKQPLSGGMLEADEIARTALFLLGPESSNITGQVIAVDGGWSVLP